MKMEERFQHWEAELKKKANEMLQKYNAEKTY